MSEFDRGDYQPHIEMVRDLYQNKRDILNHELDQRVSDYMTGTNHTAVYSGQNPRRHPLEALWRTAVHEGIAVTPGNG